MPTSDARLVTRRPSIDRLIQWFRDNKGWLSPDVDISFSESHGFHVCATRPLTSPAIVRCPFALTISHLNLDPSQSIVPHVNSQLQPYLGKVSNELLTYLLLVEQKCLAREVRSAWQPYFDCLPSPHDMTTALWFDEDDLRQLQGTDLLPATREKKGRLEVEYRQAVSTLAKHNVKLNPDHFTFENFLWASTIVSSRAFVSTYMLPNAKTFPILFPVLDILNHSTNAKVNWTFDDSSFSLTLADQASVLPGDQIFNNYAPKQNGELLLGYGFCIPDNPIEQFAIKMRLPPEMVEAARDMGLYNPDQVPFGLPKSVVQNDQSAEQHFLRPLGHPFGRYEIHVPWLQGIPPWIVYSTFVATIMQLEHVPENTDFRKPTGILVLHLLLQIYAVIKAKSQLLPVQPHQKDTAHVNTKQKYASIYRHGQAKVLDSIRRELENVLSNLRVRDRPPTSAPALITTTEALLTLQQEYPTHFTHVTSAIHKTYNVDPSMTPPPYQSPAQEKHLWTILLFVFAYITLTSPTRDPTSLIQTWILEYLEIYTLPSIASLHPPHAPPPPSPPSQTANAKIDTINDSTLAPFILDSTTPITHLNTLHTRVPQSTLDERYADLPIWDDEDEFGLVRLGDKVLAWATLVVEVYAVVLDEEGGCSRVGMYVRPFGKEEKWVYQG